MSRPLRLEFPNALYHVTSRGDRRENIYEDDDDRLKFLEILGMVVTDYNWLCHGYCLMDNHYHLIIETLEGNLSKGMRQLNGVYTQASNRRHGRSGHLFQGRYKAILVDKDRYSLELSRYVVLNPLRVKGLIDRLEDWPWSSYLAMVGDASKPEWLTTDWILSLFGKRKKIAMKRYRQFVLDGVQHQPEIWSNLKGQIYLGDEAFVAELQKRIGKEKGNINIPRQQKRPIAKPLVEIAAQYKDRNEAIIAAYKTGTYSQREIGVFYQLHPTTIGTIVRKFKSS
ncbi:REP element-mobilizing transposase RayT [Nitrosomonas nitrosa]|uniref:REP element-mobilizing transposase RayT n=1 Tax=Nitrosomonas nitrosa TaxID=52442 RepID=A0A1I4KSF4_9PROT|nr:transposase [Nitrosomonas nitrosa]SFL81541.1 REP element-mobilizing transposase RayT [Nitrosomonas nitrosa]